jgi:hypothetical protein
MLPLLPVTPAPAPITQPPPPRLVPAVVAAVLAVCIVSMVCRAPLKTVGVGYKLAAVAALHVHAAAEHRPLVAELAVSPSLPSTAQLTPSTDEQCPLVCTYETLSPTHTAAIAGHFEGSNTSRLHTTALPRTHNHNYYKCWEHGGDGYAL